MHPSQLNFTSSFLLLLQISAVNTNSNIIFSFFFFLFLVLCVSSSSKCVVICGPEERVFDPKFMTISVSCPLLKPTVWALYHGLRVDSSCLVDHTLDLSCGRLRCNRFLNYSINMHAKIF